LASGLTGLDLSVLQIKTKIISCLTANSKPVKQEVNGTVILPPLVFPGLGLGQSGLLTMLCPLANKDAMTIQILAGNLQLKLKLLFLHFLTEFKF
jgi:hypothetical protein